MIKSLIRRMARTAAGLPPIEDHLRLTTPQGHPNVNPLWAATKDLDALKLNVKMLAYELAHSMEHRLQAIPVEGPRTIGLESKPVTQADIETRWFRNWCEQLRERPRYHRSLWCYAYVLQALHEGGALKPESRLLGLDAGGQPLPSYLARLGLAVTVTGDEPPRRLDDMIEQAGFLRLVEHRPMAEAVAGSGRFDALWSLSQLSSRGSIARGVDHALACMAALKPGGTAVHVLEFNYADDERTIDDWTTVLFQRRHIEELAQRLKGAGHAVAPLNFHVGHQPLDRYVDLPPFDTDRTAAFDRLWRDGWGSAHLKASIDGFACTSFGLIVRRAA
jgi:hypothetical protein